MPRTVCDEALLTVQSNAIYGSHGSLAFCLLRLRLRRWNGWCLVVMGNRSAPVSLSRSLVFYGWLGLNRNHESQLVAWFKEEILMTVDSNNLVWIDMEMEGQICKKNVITLIEFFLYLLKCCCDKYGDARGQIWWTFLEVPKMIQKYVREP